MTTQAALVLVAGLVAEAVGWFAVARRGRDVWCLMPYVLGAMGVAAVVAMGGDLAIGTAAEALAGAAVGIGLYVATRVFVWVASRWEPFRRHVVEKYEEADEVSLARSLLLSLLVMVPAEELFWRGFAQADLTATSMGAVAGSIFAWALYVAANVASLSLPIVAGAIVGGGVWAWLWWATGGMLAPLASHILWTGLMLALPPGAGREGVRG
jgi:membrane protease YdiL (CAAX protease family)